MWCHNVVSFYFFIILVSLGQATYAVIMSQLLGTVLYILHRFISTISLITNIVYLVVVVFITIYISVRYSCCGSCPESNWKFTHCVAVFTVVWCLAWISCYFCLFEGRGVAIILCCSAVAVRIVRW